MGTLLTSWLFRKSKPYQQILSFMKLYLLSIENVNIMMMTTCLYEECLADDEEGEEREEEGPLPVLQHRFFRLQPNLNSIFSSV